MYTLNDKIKNLVPYEPISGEYNIRLDANESYMNLSDNILSEIRLELSKIDFNRYPDPLAKDLCKTFADLYNINYENVVAGNGSDELIYLIFNGFLMKGETYATFEKDFSMYNFYGSLSECKSITIPKMDDFSIDIKKTIQICTDDRIKLLIFSNPCNPTGLGIKIEDVKLLLTSLKDTLIIVDEAYMDFWNQSMLALIDEYPNMLILKTCSKALGLASMRVGFAVGNIKLINAIKAIKSPYNMDSFSQIIAAIVLKHKDECIRCTKEITESTRYFYNILKPICEENNLEILESVSNFIVIKTNLAKDIYKYLLSNKIAVRCFDEFLRICAGTEFEMNETAFYIEKYFNK